MRNAAVQETGARAVWPFVAAIPTCPVLRRVIYQETGSSSSEQMHRIQQLAEIVVVEKNRCLPMTCRSRQLPQL